MIYGYVRVDSNARSITEVALTGQKAQLREAGAEYIFEESATGTNLDRPELNKLLAAVKPGDTIVVVNLNRIARDITHLCNIVGYLLDRGVTINALDTGVIDNGTTATGRLMRSVFRVFAKWVRDS